MRRTTPWLISVPTLKQGENRLKFELDVEELGGTSHEVSENPTFQELVGPVKVELMIVKTGRKLLVNGKVRFRARLICALCGCGFEPSFEEQLSSEFVGEEELALEAGELGSEELDRDLLKGNLLNLSGVVRDAIHLGIPIAPKCRPDCKGVCLACGANLNEVQCGCLQAEAK